MSAASFSSPFASPHTCQFCQKLVINPFYIKDLRWEDGSLSPHHGIQSERIQQWLSKREEYFRRRDSYNEIYSNLIVIFDITFYEVWTLRRGCSLLRSMRRPGPEFDDEFLIGLIEDERITFAYLSFDFKFHGKIIKPDGPYVNLHLVMSYGVRMPRYSIVATQGSLAASEIYCRPVNVTPGSGASLQLSHGWLQSCLSTHNQCTKPTGAFMPSRCIEMSTLAGRPFLRLRKCAETGVRPYVALSYCWGRNQQYVTTQSTLSQHYEQIIASKLPATLLHAIEVAMGLGINYLWVDSLCIVQDDAADKAKEIDLMPMIYSEAIVTIAASRASGVREGFLHSRIYIPNISQVPYMVSGHQTDSVFLVEDIDEEVEPLDLRAWAMQERVLSPRVLEYGSLQTRFICQSPPKEGLLTDGLRRVNSKRAVYSDDAFRQALKTILEGSFNQHPTRNNLSDPSDTLSIWYQIINAYSRRSLTFPGDRLPAISGIASRFADVLNYQYCAGLWRSHLKTELLWTIAPDAQPDTRTLHSQGPSWSWASITSPVLMPLNCTRDNDFRIFSCETQFEVSTSGRPGFGAVKTGSIKLEGRLKVAAWKYQRSSDQDQPGRRRHEIRKWYGNVVESGLLPLLFSPDAVEREFCSVKHHILEDPMPLSVYLLKVSQFEDVARGLVLRRLDEVQYLRLGVFELSPEYLDTPFGYQLAQIIPDQQYSEYLKWLDSGPVTKITIL